jgi:hypothetical protein
MTYISIDPRSKKSREMMEIHQKQARKPSFFRTLKQVQQLMQPWQLEEVKGLEEWHEVTDQIAPEDRVGAGFNMSGAFFRR